MTTRRLIFVGMLLLICCSTCFAKFTVYMRDGSSQEVSKIYFNRDSADLYLVSGAKVKVPVSGIDFDKSGFKRPESLTATVYGVNVAKSATGATQAELEAMWNGSRETVYASQPLGSIAPGQAVRIVEHSMVSTVVITRDSDGLYKRVVIDNDTFVNDFVTQLSQPGSAKKGAKGAVPAPAAEPPAAGDLGLALRNAGDTAELPEPQGTLTPVYYLGAGALVICLILLVLAIKVPGLMRALSILAILAVLGLAGKSAYARWSDYQLVDVAQKRVHGFFENIMKLSDEDSVRAAVSAWSRGESEISNSTELAAARSECFKWMESGGLGVVRAYSVEGSRIQSRSAPVVVAVYVTVDSRLKKILVSPGQPLGWEE